MDDLDRVMTTIAELSYEDLRTMATSLCDVMTDREWTYAQGGEASLVPLLYDWACGWESDDTAEDAENKAAA
jgi:hypothetical protein